MPIRREAHITREMVRAEPDAYWVFGDNLARTGLGGQAREMRGEPNAIGIPTKRRPSQDPGAYFADIDQDVAVFRLVAAPAFQRLRAHIETGGTVVFPSDGIGTGLADLERRAPRIWASLQRAIARLERIGAANGKAVEDCALDGPEIPTRTTGKPGAGQAVSQRNEFAVSQGRVKRV